MRSLPESDLPMESSLEHVGTRLWTDGQMVALTHKRNVSKRIASHLSNEASNAMPFMRVETSRKSTLNERLAERGQRAAPHTPDSSDFMPHLSI